MKRMLLFIPLLVLLFPAITSAYSFETDEMASFRDSVRQIERDANDPTSTNDKVALIVEITVIADNTKGSFDPVRSAEIARLDKILNTRLASVRNTAANKKTSALRAINKACARKKRNKTAAQKAVIEKRCQDDREDATQRVDKWLARKEATIQGNFGASSAPRQNLQAEYERVLGVVNNLLKRATDSINARPLPSYILSIVKAGTGAGSVLSDPSGINCGTDCSGSFTEGSAVTLTAAAEAGSVFAGWSGASCGQAITCTVNVSRAESITATFNDV